MNYILKNLILFVSVVAVFMLSLIGAHVFSLDHEVILEKTEQLASINNKFSEDLQSLVKKSFSAVNFLAKTSYPAVALDFGMSQQFFDVAREILPDDGMGLILINQDRKITSTFGIDQNLFKNPEGTQIDDEKLIVSGNNLIYYKTIVSNGAIRGYLAGIYPLGKIQRAIQSSYRDAASGLESLNPSVMLATSSDTSFPLSVDFQSHQPPLFQPVINSRWLAAIILFSLMILAAFTYLLRFSLKQPIDDLRRIAMQFSRNDIADMAVVRLPKDPLFHGIAESLLIMNQQRREFETLQREKEIGIKLHQVAQQVAHDIRSPLAALTMVTSHLQELPEENRLLIRSAVQRIHDIANDLAGKRSQASDKTEVNDELSLQLLSGIVDTLISEKRLQHRTKIGVEIDGQLEKSSYGLFAKIQPVEFKRVLSNLINNAVEGVGGAGRIDIKLFSEQDHIRLQVADNGKGIPADILPRLMQRGETHGKSGGSGLGLYHAKSSVEKWDGNLTIESTVGVGTTVTITLPLQIPPKWFVPQLALASQSIVVIVDDDNSIHQIWKGRFESSDPTHQIKLVHFSMPDELSTWHRNQNENSENITFLCDYEFLGNEKTGLDVVRELKIQRNAILVTSRFEETSVRQGCENLGVRLIPKNLAGFVPITIADSSVATPKTEMIDAVLIDDDELVHMNWKMAAKRKNKIVRIYAGPEEFWKESSEFPKDTPIYVDSNLADGVKGEDVSWMMGKKGFSNLHLATGYEASQFDEMPWLKSIVGKAPPWPS